MKEVEWKFCQRDPESERELAADLGVSGVLATLLRNRALDTPDAARAFLSPRLGDLEDPSVLHQMEAASDRLRQAIRNRESILVYGDYDVDGMVGTVILLNFLALSGIQARHYIPNRLTEGYSFNMEAVQKLLESDRRPDLLITVDHGTSATEPIAELAAAGVDVIVTDHHEPPDVLPGGACALVNPRHPECESRHKDACGAAVAFKLAWATAQKLSGATRVTPEFKEFLTEAMAFVALATVTDVVPLADENRILCHHGLRAMAHSRNPGILALLRNARLKGRSLTATDFGFQIGPRINAAGRMGVADLVIDLFTTRDPARASAIADKLETANQQRRSLDRALLEHVLGLSELEGFDGSHGICLGGRGWHHGVIGIVAARLVDRYHVPVVLAAFDDDGGRASVRSIPGIHARDMLAAGADHLKAFGGHAGAAGCSLAEKDFPAFKESWHAATREAMQATSRNPELEVDMELPFKQIRTHLVEEIGRLAPHGRQNPMPVFATRGVQVAGQPRIMGKDGEHLAFHAKHQNCVFRAICFGGAGWAERLRAPWATVDLAYNLKFDDFRGTGAVELLVQDLKTAGSGKFESM